MIKARDFPDAVSSRRIMHSAPSKSKSFSLKNENGRISLISSNDTDLADGPADQVFDRFTRLSNADGVDGNGLGLSFVKETVKSLNGRLSASVANGVFTLKIAF